jgi:hypothetical protein
MLIHIGILDKTILRFLTPAVCSIILVFFSNSSNSQDTSLVKSPVDSLIYQDNILSESRHKYVNPDSPDTISRLRFLWYPLKLVDDLFSYLPGYYLRFADVGQINELSYNQLDHYYTAVLRHGRPINDLIDGSIDLNLLSRNEISEIEVTNGFGNTLYNNENSVNVIQRQMFQYRPYSEISFWQDRFENLYLDANYHQNFFKGFNFNFGITKHSYDGKYLNSDFDKWLGRFNFNYFGFKNFSIFLYSNYSKIKRGLNEGIDPLKSPLDKESLMSAAALVRNSDSYEIRERFDIDLGFIWAYGKKKNSYTKLQLFTSNLFREYRDEENRPNPNGVYIKDNSHWINYGVKIQQVFSPDISKYFQLTSKTELEYDRDIIHSNDFYLKNLKESFRMFFSQNLFLNSRFVGVNVFGKSYRFNYFCGCFYFDFGAKGEFKLELDSINVLTFYVQYNNSQRLPPYQLYRRYNEQAEKVLSVEAGGKFRFKYGEISSGFYHNSRLRNITYDNTYVFSINSTDYYKTGGINLNLNLRLWKIHFDLTHQYNFNSQIGDKSLSERFYPENTGNVSLYYLSRHFKNKLEVKIGITSRYWTEHNVVFYRGINNIFVQSYSDSAASLLKLKRNATLDFFIIGKINRAVFGLTLENILNRAVFTTGVYPYMSRGGLFNVISRFNITWYFLN